MRRKARECRALQTLARSWYNPRNSRSVWSAAHSAAFAFICRWNERGLATVRVANIDGYNFRISRSVFPISSTNTFAAPCPKGELSTSYPPLGHSSAVGM